MSPSPDALAQAILAAGRREAFAPALSLAQREQLAAWFDTHLELSLSRVLATSSN